ncbi:integrase core domain-containing protein [Burkholderia lata]
MSGLPAQLSSSIGSVGARDAKRLIEEWRIEYNTERPHSSLG